MPNLANLHPFPEGGPVVMVVESPRGSTVKLRYDTKSEIFIVARALPTGTTYPFDWGFIPGTRGEDGDPLDAMALHDAATYPGVVLPCRVLGMVEVTQNGKTGRESNPRFILVPSWNDRMGQLAEIAGLPSSMRDEIEQFFLNATFFTGKDAHVESWHGRRAAEKILRRHVIRKD